MSVCKQCAANRKGSSSHYLINATCLLKRHLEMTWFLIETPERHRMKLTYFRRDEKQQLWYFEAFLHSTL